MKSQKYNVNFDIDFKRNTYPGKFIVFEGIEASGKTTHTRLIGKILGKNNKVFLTKNPTNSIVGNFIRKSLLAGKIRMPAVAIQYLFGADREIQQEEIIKHLKKGDIVISDRYFWSSVAYGAADIETDYDNFANLSLTAFSLLSMYNQFIVPDFTIYLDISIKESMKRISSSKKHTEIYDNERMNIRVEKGYKWLIKKFPKEFVILNGEGTVEQVNQRILDMVKNNL